VEQSKKTANLIKDCKLEIIHGEGHDFSGAKEKVHQLLVDFLAKHLTNSIF